MSLQIKAMFDNIARKYDLLNHVLSAGRDLAWRRKAVRLLAKQNNSRVLDLCGGTGDFLLAWNKNNSSLALGLIGDFSLPMLRLAQIKTHTFYAAQIDALAPAIKAGSFDVVLCGFGMRNLDSLPEGIRQVKHLLAPGGVFVTLEFFRPTTLFTRFFYAVFAPMAIPAMAVLLASQKQAYKYLVSSILGFRSAQEYQKLCEANGFKNCKIVSCDFGIAHIILAYA